MELYKPPIYNGKKGWANWQNNEKMQANIIFFVKCVPFLSFCPFMHDWTSFCFFFNANIYIRNYAPLHMTGTNISIGGNLNGVIVILVLLLFRRSMTFF